MKKAELFILRPRKINGRGRSQTTVNLDSAVLEALRAVAHGTGRSLSDVINDGSRAWLDANHPAWRGERK